MNAVIRWCKSIYIYTVYLCCFLQFGSLCLSSYNCHIWTHRCTVGTTPTVHCWNHGVVLTEVLVSVTSDLSHRLFFYSISSKHQTKLELSPPTTQVALYIRVCTDSYSSLFIHESNWTFVQIPQEISCSQQWDRTTTLKLHVSNHDCCSAVFAMIHDIIYIL